MALGYNNRCVTRRRLRDENHVVRFRQSAENWSLARDMQLIRRLGCLWWACKGVQALVPPGFRKKKSSLWVCLSIYLSTNKLWALFKNKMRYFYKKVFRLYLYCWDHQVGYTTIVFRIVSRSFSLVGWNPGHFRVDFFLFWRKEKKSA